MTFMFVVCVCGDGLEGIVDEVLSFFCDGEFEAEKTYEVWCLSIYHCCAFVVFMEIHLNMH